MAKVFAVFFGGSSYSPYITINDLEEFDSIQDAKEALRNRYKGYDSYYPTVDQSATMELWFTKPNKDDEIESPDRTFGIGKRGGVIEF